MRYQYLLFDHDGVLVDTEFWYFEATRRALAELDIVLDRDNYQQIMIDGQAAWILAERAGVPQQLIDEKKRQRNAWYQRYLREENIEIPGVVDVLRSLAPDHGMAIVTTSKGVDFEVIHRERSIVEQMDFVLTREDYVNSKPDPEPYLLALQRFDADPSEALVIEDSQRGLRAAVAAGIDCAVVHNEFTSAHDFSDARYRIGTLAELPELLLS